MENDVEYFVCVLSFLKFNLVFFGSQLTVKQLKAYIKLLGKCFRNTNLNYH